MKKIAIDASIYREPASGVHLAVQQAVTAEVSCLCEKNSVEVYSRLQFPGVKNTAPPPWTSSPAGRIFWQQFCLPSLMRKSGIEALHAQAYTLPLRTRVPTLLNVHDIIALEAPELCSWENAWQMRCLLPRSVRRATKCLVPTRYVAERLMTVLGVTARKIEVVGWGVDFQRFHTASQCTLPVPERYFLFVGNLEPKKNLPLLLSAYSQAAASCRCSLLIVGRAAWKSTAVVRALQSWSETGEVLWLGRVSDAELVGLYQHALALVMPSLYEGFGLPVLEAMAAGCPVIHSRQQALAEVAGGAGLAFTATAVDELRVLLARVATDENLRAELRAAGWQRARACPWSRCGQQVAEVLLSL